MRVFLPTPAGLLAPDHCGAATWPLVCEQQRLPQKVFRRSIVRLSDSQTTLRRGRYLPTTQDSLPVAGQALPDGLHTRKIPLKGFEAVQYILSPFPKLAWRNHIDRSVERRGAESRRCNQIVGKQGASSGHARDRQNPIDLAKLGKDISMSNLTQVERS